MEIKGPISLGELIDKITILEIKNEKINDIEKLNNISNELRFKQILYKQYLSWYDYRKVFSTNLPDIKPRTFPGRMGAIIVLIDKFTAVLPKRFRLIKYLSYFSHYSFAFKYFSLKEFIFQIPYINCPPQGRGVMGMIINKWKVLNKQLLSSPRKKLYLF